MFSLGCNPDLLLFVCDVFIVSIFSVYLLFAIFLCLFTFSKRHLCDRCKMLGLAAGLAWQNSRDYAGAQTTAPTASGATPEVTSRRLVQPGWCSRAAAAWLVQPCSSAGAAWLRQPCSMRNFRTSHLPFQQCWKWCNTTCSHFAGTSP